MPLVTKVLDGLGGLAENAVRVISGKEAKRIAQDTLRKEGLPYDVADTQAFSPYWETKQYIDTGHSSYGKPSFIINKADAAELLKQDPGLAKKLYYQDRADTRQFQYDLKKAEEMDKLLNELGRETKRGAIIEKFKSADKPLDNLYLPF